MNIDLIYEIININESIKNNKFEGVNKEISKKKRFLIWNLNNFILFKILRAFWLISKWEVLNLSNEKSNIK